LQDGTSFAPWRLITKICNLKKRNSKSASLVILALLFVFPGCEKTEINNNPELIINAGFVCGWGSGLDSINISRTAIKYRYWIPATTNAPVINKTRSVSESEWKEILAGVDMAEFVKLNYQSCNVCADGCDEWISIRDGKGSNKITFGKGIEIGAISSLQSKLAELRTEFSH
jgi:hypothetical protein